MKGDGELFEMRRRTEKDNYQDISGRGEDKMKKTRLLSDVEKR